MFDGKRIAGQLGGESPVQCARALSIDSCKRLVERAILSGRKPPPDVGEAGVAAPVSEPLEKRRAGEVRERPAFVCSRRIELLVCRKLAFERPLSEERRPPRSIRAAG